MHKSCEAEFRQESEHFLAQTEAYVSTMRTYGQQVLIPCKSGQQAAYYHRGSALNAPTVFEIHGGCFSQGTAANDDEMRQAFCAYTGFHVIGLGYRKSTHSSFPAALEDIYDEINYFVNHAAQYGIDTSKLAVWGHSAGGNLAFQAVWMGQKSKKYGINLLMLDYPYLDLYTEGNKRSQTSDGLTAERLDAMRNVYAPNIDRKLFWISPIFASDEILAALPPVSMTLCGYDPLQKEGVDMLKRLLYNGVPVTAKLYTGMEHGFVELWYFREWYMKNTHISKQMEESAQDALEFQALSALRYLK